MAEQEIKVVFQDHLKGGVYCNNAIITHTREEFIVDFMVIVPPTGAVTSRVIMSPPHIKRVLSALQENIKKYEDKFGEIKPAEKPKGKLGFHK
jgi:hypothetical protein